MEGAEQAGEMNLEEEEAGEATQAGIILFYEYFMRRTRSRTSGQGLECFLALKGKPPTGP